jgi:hypothetical protein
MRFGNTPADQELVHRFGSAIRRAVRTRLTGPPQLVALLKAPRDRLTSEERDVADGRGARQGWAAADGPRMQLKRALDRIAPELDLDNDRQESADA